MTSTAARKNSGDSKPRRQKEDASQRELRHKCGRLLGQRVTKLEYPGGRSRKSFRLVLADGGTAIASIRPKQYRADVERAVLKKLSAKGVLVPKLLASDGENLLIQEEVRGRRLSEALHDADEARVEQLLDGALGTLSHSHRVASAAGFDSKVTKLGGSLEWLVGFLDRPAVIGNILGVPAARPALEQLESLLAVRKPRFVKWDSRPGNAMVTKDAQVYWFDWEHSGARNRLDDMAWLLADEYVPDHPEMEARLIDKHITHFADDLSSDEARHYLSAYGVFHLSVRLGLICKYKRKKSGDWWDHEYCLKRDKVGVSLASARRVCDRGARWARLNPYTEPLAPWFKALRKHFEADLI